MLQWLKKILMKLKCCNDTSREPDNREINIDPSAEYYQEQTSFAYQMKNSNQNSQDDYDGMEP